MSASRLLRILQTLPVAAADEISTTDQAESINKSSRCTNPFLSNEDFNFWNNPQLETSVFGDNYTNNDKDEAFRKSCAECNVVPSDLFEETTRFYVDKNAVECELPELMVCYKESDIQIKDICINEEIMPHDETISINKTDTHNQVNGDDDDDDDNDMIEASLDSEFLKNEWLRPSLVTNCFMDVVEFKSSVGFSSTLQNATENHGSDSLRKRCDEKMNSQPLNKVPKDEKPIHHQDMEVVSKNETRYVEGELSFSMAGVISELISCSRPITFSGGISARSDSSATSNRSFAFPTVETEYIGSPVRMGRAERRRLQKQRGWRQGLLCCKF